MAFKKIQAKEIVKGIEQTHKTHFRLAAYVKVEAQMSKNLTHFPQSVIDVKHENINSAFQAFRKRFPFGQYMIVVMAGDDVPASPPDTQRVRQLVAKLRGKFQPKQEAPPLMLDTNWLDKAFEYQKRATY